MMSCLASLGLIAATIYSLRIVQKVFLGNKNTDWKMNDLTLREKVVSASLVIAIFWLGLFPKPVLDTAKPAILKILNKQEEITFQNLRGNTVNALLVLLPPSQSSPTGEGVQYLRIKNEAGIETIISPLGEIRKGVKIKKMNKQLN
jgi:NADH:ubiquinone oxidoreductase subunit 5 (subunit L)/multisubunit Na+/H+ antiporter MnhA subunit